MRTHLTKSEAAFDAVNPVQDQNLFIDHNVIPFSQPIDWAFEPCASHYDNVAVLALFASFSADQCQGRDKCRSSPEGLFAEPFESVSSQGSRTPTRSNLEAYVRTLGPSLYYNPEPKAVRDPSLTYSQTLAGQEAEQLARLVQAYTADNGLGNVDEVLDVSSC